jgi:hypothetical protein
VLQTVLKIKKTNEINDKPEDKNKLAEKDDSKILIVGTLAIVIILGVIIVLKRKRK